ncbi:MAG: hypothetical protein IJA87_04320 [Clostridia bacterium]|nr:hypothetical protein [Clostridia bacterium]
MKRDTKFLIISSVISLVISVFVTALFSQYADLALANLGVESAIINLADKSRECGSYEIAIDMYLRIIKKDNEYSPYAKVALGEIFSSYAKNYDYKKAFGYYESAIMASSDKIILDSCLKYIVEAYDSTKNENDASKPVFDVLNDKNIDFVLNVFNKYIALEPNRFKEIGIESDLSRQQIISFLEGETLKVIKTDWHYDFTKYDYNGNLSYINSNEKLLLVDQWQELIDANSFSTVTVYKYYHYIGTNTEEEINFMNHIRNWIEDVDNIELSKISFQNETEA